MRLRARTLGTGTIGLSAGFILTLVTMVMPAQMSNSA
jgi:tetrahydromethanopterin S-methyltransferase subunit F